MTTTPVPGPQFRSHKSPAVSRIVGIGLAAIVFTALIVWACTQMAGHVRRGDRILAEVAAAIVVSIAAAGLGWASARR